MFWTFQNIRIGLQTNTKVAANLFEVIRISTVLCDPQRMPIRIGSQTKFATVGRGHKEVVKYTSVMSSFSSFIIDKICGAVNNDFDNLAAAGQHENYARFWH